MNNSAKKLITKSLSGFLAFMTIVTLLASLSLLPVFAADEEEEEEERAFEDIYSDYYMNPFYDATVDDLENPDFTTQEKRLEAMTLQYTKGDFQLYIDPITGEVAVKDMTTGDILFTNPYDIAEIPTSAESGTRTISLIAKRKLLSQVSISYTDNDVVKSYNSFVDAALLQQIDIKKLKGGVRVEYSIGEEESRTLVPRRISVDRYNEMIIGQLEENLPNGRNNNIFLRVTAWYILKDPANLSGTALDQLYADYPITKEFPIYIFAEDAKPREIKVVEGFIKTYCPEYTFEEMDKDHRETGYESKDKAPANFKMALEYYLTDSGVEVRFPANGLTFDETNYQLSNIDILQYMGAGSNDYYGYTFVPDGSGTLIRFEDVSKTFELTGKVYGQDYAYQEISNANQEVFRMPVFGVVVSDEKQNDPRWGDYYYQVKDGSGNVTLEVPKEQKLYSTGYFAVVTEGDALTNITSSHGGNQDHYFNSVYCSFNPRPKDSYNLAEAISIGSNTKYTVVSDRKYTGSFRINYIMLTDPENTEGRNPDRTYYETSYVGMAKAYRDYLEKTGSITRLTAENVQENIPLYMEVFGVTETDETILSIPITVKKALTSFENLKTMITELKAGNISNLNFKLTGFTNGGMVPTVPTGIKYESVVGKNSGFRDFLDYAVTEGVGVYPEFDFAYMMDTAMFDGFSYRRDAVKTIDNRYITRREYDAVLQTFVTSGKICISPCVYGSFFEKFNKSFTKLLEGRTTNISLSTMGSDLNSDFDDDDPYNREDAKNFTTEMLKQFTVNGSYGKIMVDSGNAYSIPYASVVLNAPLDSSRYLNTSEAVPFFGMVYHGYLVFAGKPTNSAGDINYEILKIIENGATLFMQFSYQNVEILKEDPTLSKYYAISYEIWKETLISKYDGNGNLVSLGLYDQLNNALKDVQTSLINDHAYLDCIRQFTDQERQNITTDATAAYNSDYSIYDADYQKYASLVELHDRLMAEYDEKLKEAGVYDNSSVITWLTDEEKAAIVALGNGAVLDEIIRYYTEQADEANVQTYTALKDQYNVIINDRTAMLSAYGVSNRDNLVAQRDTIKANRDALDLNDYIEDEENEIDRDISDGSVVYVEYDNGHWFVLNYNNFVVDVVVEGQTLTIQPKDFYDSRATA